MSIWTRGNMIGNYSLEMIFGLCDVENIESLKNIAFTIMSEAHKKQFDKNGSPYINHCMRVADSVKSYGANYEIVGMIHDAFGHNDSISFDILKKIGYDAVVIQAITLLARDESISYKDYILNIFDSNNHIAKVIKYYDLKDNATIKHIKTATEEDFKQAEQYEEYIAILEDELFE